VPINQDGPRGRPTIWQLLFDNHELSRLAGVSPLPKPEYRSKSLILEDFTCKSFKLKDLAGISA